MFIFCVIIYLILLYCLGVSIIWVFMFFSILNFVLSVLLRMGWVFVYIVEYFYNFCIYWGIR